MILIISSNKNIVWLNNCFGHVKLSLDPFQGETATLHFVQLDHWSRFIVKINIKNKPYIETYNLN